MSVAHHIVLFIALLALSGVGACRQQDALEHPENFTDQIRQSVTSTPSGGLSLDLYLQGVARVPVEGFDAIPSFSVAKRTSAIRRFPCQDCHTEPIESLKPAEGTHVNAHWEIQLRHADSHMMNCATCHPSQKMSTLKSLGGHSVEFDHSYQVCQQCHFTQVRDWAGGAHGKRLEGWAEPRVVMNCTQCHNPHQPQLTKRWPVRASTLPNEMLH